MRKFLIAICLTGPAAAWAQLPDDALRYGYPLNSGSARNQAIGGAMGSLGGDISAAHINPAGLGLYKSNELVLTPGYNFLNNKFDYRGQKNSAKDKAFNYGTSGFVFGGIRNNPNRQVSSETYAITINQLANYNNHIEYKGFNNISTWSEQYLEEATRDLAGKSKQDIINALERNYIFGTSLAYWTYLIDTVTDGNKFQVQSLVPIPAFPTPGNTTDGVNQHNIIDTRGGAHELALSYGNSYNDKLHLGASVAFPIYNYTRHQTYREEDASGNPNNDFAFFEYTEDYRTKGWGVNAKLGLIYRPVDKIRLGLAFHTPGIITLKDELSSSITANTESYTVYQQPATKSSDELREGSTTAGMYQYSTVTPLRLIASGSYVLNETSEIKKQKGFITGDIEMVNYGGVRYTAMDETNTDDVNYYTALNSVIKKRYKTAFNFKLGGELKFNTIMTRLGLAHYGSPYEDKALKASRTLLSGGLGYRNHGIFIDLTYVHAFINEKHVPYYLNDKPSPIADGKNARGNVVLSFGVKL